MNQQLATKALNYVAVTSALTKRALDELSVHQTSQEKAASMRGDVLDTLVNAGCVGDHQKQAAEAMLGSHAETLGLLKSAAEKIGKLQEQVVKQASDLGQGEDPASVGGSTPDYDSINDGYVGRKTGEKKASDLAILKVLDAPS
jgi:hypothetical protein